jgi:O-antigen ligase
VVHPPVDHPIEQASSPPGFGRLALGLVALAAVVGTGLLLGRVLTSPTWTWAVTGVGLSAVALTALLSPSASLLLWIVLAPFASHIYLKLQLGRGIPDLDVTRLMTLLLLYQMVSQVVLRTGWQPVRLSWIEVAMAGFTAAMILALPMSSLGLVGGLQTVFDFVVAPFLVFYFSRNWLRSRRSLMAAIAAVALVSALLGLITAREQLTGHTLFSPVHYSLVYEGKIRKVLSVFGSPAAMTTPLAVSVPAWLYGLRQTGRLRWKVFLGVALICVLAGVFFAYVRAGWLGVLIGLAILVWLSPPLRRALLALLPMLILIGATVSAVAVVSPEMIQGRLTSQEPITYRLTAWRLAWELFLSSPVIGIGYDEFGRVAAGQFGWNPHRITMVSEFPAVHNSYLYVLVSGGLVALIPYLALFAGLLWRGYRFWRHPWGEEERAEARETVATLWATLISYMVIIGTFDVQNAQFANLTLFLLVGALVGRLEEMGRLSGVAG